MNELNPRTEIRARVQDYALAAATLEHAHCLAVCRRIAVQPMNVNQETVIIRSM